MADLGASFGRIPSTIERAIRKLRKPGRQQRVGPDKGGHCQVIE